jgi:SNF2 family DNA or RNA helicase
MWVKFIYDTYGKSHSSSLKSIGITIDDLDDGSFVIKEGLNAMEYYNNMFKDYPRFLIPVAFLQDTADLYKLLVYSKVIKNIEYTVTTVSINSVELKKLVENNTEIPSKKFISNLLLCNKNMNMDMIYVSDAKIIEQAANFVAEKVDTPIDYTNDKAIKAEDANFINMRLFDYQRCSINWLLDKELNQKTVYYNINKEILIGDVYYCDDIAKFNLKHNRDNITFKGGALIDEVGLGKTIQAIALSLLNPAKDLNYIDPKFPNVIKSRATIIFSPNQLCTQWENEIKTKLINPDKYKIVKMCTKNDLNARLVLVNGVKMKKQVAYKDLLDADFVIVSFTFLDNPAFTGQWVSLLSPLKSHHKKSIWDKNDNLLASKLFTDMRKDLATNLKESLEKVNPLIQLVHWHRIVVDEFHESYSRQDNKYLQNIIRHMVGTYKWAVTATPFTSKVTGIVNTLQYTTDYACESVGENILKDETICEYASNEMFRRNTKKSVEEIEKYNIPPVEEEIMWLKFTVTERMIYNANLANPKNDKYSVYLRQLCCHPQLAEETKYALSNCKSLPEIEKLMGEIYKNDVIAAEKVVNKCKKQIFVTKIRLIIDFLKSLLKDKIKIQITLEDLYDSYGENVDKVTDKDVETKYKVFDQYVKDIFKLNVTEKYQKYIACEKELANYNLKLEENIRSYEGKKITENFFTNVIDKLRNTQKSGKVRKEFVFDLDNLDDEDEEEDEDEEKCPICLSPVIGNDVGVTRCGHIYCYTCLKIVIDTKHKCPICSTHLKNYDVFTLSYDKNEDKLNKTDMDLLNSVGTKLGNLIFFLRKTTDRCIIFSQWDDLLIKVGKILSDNGVKNVFCKGNCYQRDKAIREFKNSNDMRVIMLSSSNTASGTNLTEANRIIFLDPIYGDYDHRKNQEKQAIGRAHRMGQTKTVIVNRFIIRESVEEDIYKMNREEDLKHPENLKKIIREISV